MNIGVFSKIDMCGGSEFRCAEMCNGIAKHTKHSAFLLSEAKMPEKIKDKLNPKVRTYENVFLPEPINLKKLYEMDTLLIINTDAKDFTTADYWQGKSQRHSVTGLDLSKLGQMVFLFNFIVSPSRHLDSLCAYNKNIKILTAGRKFFLEIGEQDRYERVRHIPRMQLNSPINSEDYDLPKTKSKKLRIGMHSKGASGKWNKDWPKLIEMCNERMKDRISFDLMGMNRDTAKKIKTSSNVKLRKEDSITVPKYLKGLDIFCFFPDFRREEPWARCTAEALVSGCPLLATPRGGNVDQVIRGNNGFLCKDTKAFFQKIVYLAEHQDEVIKMSENAKLVARDYSTEKVIEKFMNYVE